MYIANKYYFSRTAEFTGSDHLPQVLHLRVYTQGHRTPPDNPPAFAWDRFNKEHAKRLAEGLDQPGLMHTPEDAEYELASLVRRLSSIAELAAGRQKADAPTRPGT